MSEIWSCSAGFAAGQSFPSHAAKPSWRDLFRHGKHDEIAEPDTRTRQWTRSIHNKRHANRFDCIAVWWECKKSKLSSRINVFSASPACFYVVSWSVVCICSLWPALARLAGFPSDCIKCSRWFLSSSNVVEKIELEYSCMSHHRELDVHASLGLLKDGFKALRVQRVLEPGFATASASGPQGLEFEFQGCHSCRLDLGIGLGAHMGTSTVVIDACNPAPLFIGF